MGIDDECKELYEDEYKKFYKESPFFGSKLLGGYASRRFVHVFKVAMLISVSFGGGMVVKAKHFSAAMRIMEETERNMLEVLRLIVQSEEGGLVEEVFSNISRNGGKMTRTELTRKMQHKMKARELDDIMVSLVRAGRVKNVYSDKTITYYVKG